MKSTCAALCLVIFIVHILSGCVPPQRRGKGRYLVPPSSQSQQQQLGKVETYYSGYSQTFQPLKQQLAAGKIDDVKLALSEEETKVEQTAASEADLAKKLRLIGLMERASISLQTGDAEKTHKYCDLAQDMVEEREYESYFNEGLSELEKLIGKLFAGGKFGRYDATGFEKVLLLDLEAMAYLLDGDDRAFNVARLAILWQDAEKEKFEVKLSGLNREADKEINKPEVKKSQEAAGIIGKLKAEYSKYDDVALMVPNAFVNPFGDYVTGMVNEFKSVKIKSLISNANIAYKQALQLNPKSKVLQQAVKDTKKKRSAKRLIHVVCLDGFVPEKKVLSIPIYNELDIELPTYEPVPSDVATVKVTTMKGKVLATLSPVADIEAMALRLQKDALPGLQAMVVAAAIRDIAIVKLGDKIYSGLGNLFRRALDRFQEPDTTSWMSLPSTIMAARIYPPKGLKKIKVRSYDSKGKKLAEQVVKLGEGGRHFVLARSINKSLYAYPSKKIWTPRKSNAQRAAKADTN